MAAKTTYGADYLADFKRLRRRGYTLARCARELNVSLRTVERWSASTRPPKP